MEEVARRFPDDLDAATLSADSRMNLRPWKLYTFDGDPEPGTLEIVATLEGVLARLECSLQRGENGMRQEVDIRYVVTSLKGSAQHLYEDIYCQRGQMENLIKLHKVQLASDRMSCHSATANQVRLVLHTAAFWLMHGGRSASRRRTRSPSASSRRSGAPNQDRGASDRAHRTHPASSCPRVAQTSSCSVSSGSA
jgi:hypothetical protein